MKNSSKKSNNTSGHTGVSWDKRRRKWRSQITVDGINTTIGRFNDIKDAIAARERANVAYAFHKNHGF